MFCTLHIMLLSMEKKNQIGNSKNWCHLCAKYSMKHLEGLSITELLLTLQRRITPIQFVIWMGGKWCGWKIIEVVSYWKQLPKSKHLWLGKHGANTRYDHLYKAVKDGLVSVKLLFFEEVAKKLNEFLPIFQTDKSMAPFLTKTLEDHIKTLLGKFICKDLADKSCSEMVKSDFRILTIRKLPILLI